MADAEQVVEEEPDLLDIFIEEFADLMEIYETALREIRKPTGDRRQAYGEIFRVYHTLKGDSAYFPEFQDFTNFSKHYCEELRNLPDDMLYNEDLLKIIRLNYSRLSGAYKAMNRGNSLQAFRFKLLLKHF